MFSIFDGGRVSLSKTASVTKQKRRSAPRDVAPLFATVVATMTGLCAGWLNGRTELLLNKAKDFFKELWSGYENVGRQRSSLLAVEEHALLEPSPTS